MDSTGWPTYLFFVILLALSAFFSGSEMALSSLNIIRIKSYAQDGDKRAQAVLRAVKNFDKTLSTILIGNNVVNIGAASLGTVVATSLVGGATGIAISTFVVTVLVLVFGEILPKSAAKENAEKFALSIGGIMVWLNWVLTPVVWPFLQLKRITRRQGGEEQPSMTEQELMYMVAAIEEEGVLEEQESELVQSALEFDEITAQEILTPRVDVLAVDIADSDEEILDEIMKGSFSRVPVYENSIDNIMGVVRTRDMLEARVRGEKLNLRSVMSPCMYIHKTMKLSRLLGEFQKSKNHLAVVTDDYGGTLGIVTLEDVLEQLVGDIWDENDVVEQAVTQVDAGRYEVSGDENIYDFFEEIGYDARNFDSDFNSMGGWAMEMIGRIPEVGDSFTFDGMTVEVTGMEETRITKLLVEKLPAAENTASQE